jgi:antitoxin component YwqK of YwqJK toxin-antitoxin module
MKNILLLFFIAFSIGAQSQYYYKDIVGTREANDLIASYRKANLRSVEIISIEANGSPSKDFRIVQQFDLSQKVLRTQTKNQAETSRLSTYFNEMNKVNKTVDSSGFLANTTIYTYSPNGILQSLSSIAVDTSRGLKESEEHVWQYNAEGKPEKMLRSINNAPAMEITFEYDEDGNVAEEIWKKKGIEMDRIFYYYDDQNQLTDIVRFNKKAGRLLPDFMFEYSDNGQVIQKISVPVNSVDYQIWRYQYNNQGLKIREVLFDRDKQIVGKIEYRYQF